MEHPNLTAYEGVEKLASFNESIFEEYCKSKLSECGKQVNFVREFINDDTYTGNVIEIGSGNGKLLYALERNGMVNCGIGYELSSTRVNFANKFSSFVGSSKVKNICGNFLDQDDREEDVDLVIGVDVVMQLIAPVAVDAEMKLLNKIFRILKSGGGVILELMDFRNIIKMHQLSGSELRLWKEFDYPDPWQYGLDKISINGDDVIWHKRFINRDHGTGDSTFQNVLRHYTFQHIRDKLCLAGFNSKNIKHHKYWKSEGDIREDEFIVSAVK